MSTRRAYHHSFCFSKHSIECHLPEFLHNDSRFLRYHMLMIVMESLDSTCSRSFLIRRISLYTLGNFVSSVIRGIIFQHILNESLFYGLQHGIVVISHIFVVFRIFTFFSQLTESLQRLWLWSCRKCIEVQIVVLSLCQQIFHKGILLLFQFFSLNLFYFCILAQSVIRIGQCCFQLFCAFARL